MLKKFILGIVVLLGFFGLFVLRVYDLAYKKHDYYIGEYSKISEVYIKGTSAPRGRILDVKGRVIVDNIGVNTIVYHKHEGITKEDEIEIAKRLAVLTDYKYAYNLEYLKDFYMIVRSDVIDKLISDEERKLYSERKISKDELKKLKKERISQEMLDEMSEEEKYGSYFYNLMNEGYLYDNKILLKDIADDVYASILESNLPGIFGDVLWSRNYLYGDTLKSIMGAISKSLPKEKEYLREKGYSYNDMVGISGLEEYYEDYLRGEAAIYKVVGNNLELEKASKRGKDLVLEIDIDLQVKVEEIMREEIKKAKMQPYTEYYRESFALVSEPKSGAIRVIAGQRLNDNGEFQDVSINVIKNAYTVGSIVKAASISVGYKYGALEVGTVMRDSCVKLYNVPLKCSFKSLGVLDDVKALAWSSNYYQFITALKVAGYNYSYNMKAEVTEDDFNKYRDIFKSFGLGSTTGIDLPNESVGLKGEKIAADLLLNLAIGQYDLYTPTSLLQYTNTIANNGVKLKLNLMHSIGDEAGEVLKNEVQEMGKVELDEKYFTRIHAGLREVVKSGTGYWYVPQNIEAAGKTGTSESYIDSDYDGVMDAYVLSNTFMMYAPYDDPKYSMVVISPNVANLETMGKNYAPVNRLIARNISDLLFSSE